MNEKMNAAQNKMFYQTWWFWLILAGFILGLVALLAPGKGTLGGSNAATEEGVTGATVISAQTTVSDKKDVVLLNSGYTLNDDNDGIYWVAEYQNPEGNSTAYQFTKIIVTAYDANGAVLATEDQVMHSLQPGERQIFGSSMGCNGQKPSRVDITVESGNAKVPSEEALKASDFQIEGVNERPDELWGTTYTGTVKNNGTKDTSQVCVVVALKQDGKVVYAEDTFVDDLAAGQQKAFELNTFGDTPSHNSYEVMAYDWGY